MVETLLGPTFRYTLPPLPITFPTSNRILLSSPMSSFPIPSSPNRTHPRCYSNPNLPQSQPALLVFSGGTAFNGVVEDLKSFTTRVAHVLPVSDDGGSTAEIVRVLGGPAVGDIRSRCLRLSDQSTAEALAVRNLLGHRLSLDALQAKSEWYSIVEGDHVLWEGVSKPYRETIRAFLVYFQNQHWKFLFCRSTYIFSVLGCGNIFDGTIIRGQNEISHPSSGTMVPIKKESFSAPALPSKIKRVFYMSSEGKNLLHEVFPSPNAAVLEQLYNVDCIVYGMGSLFTSICPSLVLLGIGEIISSRSCLKPSTMHVLQTVLSVILIEYCWVLMLNGTHDRETNGFSASCFVTAITDALNRTYGESCNRLQNIPSKYINTLLVPRNSTVSVDVECLAAQGIFDVIVVDSILDPKVGIIYDPKSLIRALADLIERYMKAQVNCLIDTR
ncbi:hypothetical protein KIW84_015306 [Lathyrus oleraceus]|uniref:LPPG:FO 2-phospho-L-lactate transferase CofD/UPF0052 n=1 Tax=Pisum sativum TaxID=3888 RepID=A0A9D5BQ68_PEA|nr:hypothetical protein KIW84_015306 [Pisum sativum]